jgi:ABC-type nitrate/sulfonate/bicarbonate transport system substrate-binding protein
MLRSAAHPASLRASGPSLDQVSLQLNCKHQFQLAGRYAAVEKGFYRENGLEVEIREGRPWRGCKSL